MFFFPNDFESSQDRLLQQLSSLTTSNLATTSGRAPERGNLIANRLQYRRHSMHHLGRGESKRQMATNSYNFSSKGKSSNTTNAYLFRGQPRPLLLKKKTIMDWGTPSPHFCGYFLKNVFFKVATNEGVPKKRTCLH